MPATDVSPDNWSPEPSGYDPGSGHGAVATGTPVNQSEQAPPAYVPLPVRDRIVVLGRRASGKTIFLARLYEALWQGCLVSASKKPGRDGTLPAPVEMKARSLQGPGHIKLMKVIEELRGGSWIPATQGLDYLDLVITHGTRQHMLTALDCSGETFSDTFLHEKSFSAASELRDAVDRAAAVILLIDPSVVAKGGTEAHEDTYGMTQAVVKIRNSPGGESVPVAIVFTKTDIHRALLREAGGVNAFAQKHFAQLLNEVKSAAIFPAASVRASTNPRGATVPDLSQPPVNVVEAVRYCIQAIELGGDARSAEDRRRELQMEVRRAEMAESEVVSEERARESKRFAAAMAIGIVVAIAAVFALFKALK